MSFYKPIKEPPNNEELDERFAELSEADQAEIKKQIKNVDGELKYLKARQVARRNGNGGTKQTNFGARSGLELMHALGRWFKKVEQERPEDWVLLLRSQSKRKPSDPASWPNDQSIGGEFYHKPT